MNERDNFLTLARGFVWNEEKGYYTTDAPVINNMEFDFISYSNWEGFGKLWTWAQEQEWFVDMGRRKHLGLCVGADKVYFINPSTVDPDRFATAVYEFLKERNG